jgi:hypothetical protein
MNDNDSKS